MNQQLRLYTFCNFYLSQIQGGIQSAHVITELFNKYGRDAYRDVKKMEEYYKSAADVLEEWNRNHKTMIVLNGGANGDLQNLVELLETTAPQIASEIDFTGLPWAKFNEDEYSLGGQLTCVGIVLPESIFDTTRETSFSEETVYKWNHTVDELPVASYYRPGSATHAFLSYLKSCRLF